MRLLSAAGENAGENFRKSNSQLFLEGRTGLMTEMNPGSSGSGFNEWSMPQSRRYDASKAATFKSLQSMNGRISPSRSFPNYHGRANGMSLYWDPPYYKLQESPLSDKNTIEPLVLKLVGEDRSRSHTAV